MNFDRHFPYSIEIYNYYEKLKSILPLWILSFFPVQPGSPLHKNREFSPSDVCKGVTHKPKYETNIRLLLHRYTYIWHSLNHIGQK